MINVKKILSDASLILFSFLFMTYLFDFQILLNPEKEVHVIDDLLRIIKHHLFELV